MKKIYHLALVSILALCFFSTNAMAGAFMKSNIAPNKPAPDFTLKNINGNDFSLKSYRGKPLLLVFTTTWCPACKREIPELKKLSEKIDVVAIYINEPPDKLEKFIQKYEIPYTVLIDPLAGVAHDYDVIGVPTKVLIGGDGNVLINQCMSVDSILKKVSVQKKAPAAAAF